MKNVISLQQAIAMTTLYRSQKDKVINAAYEGQNILSTAETFDRAAFDAVLAQPGCVGLRIYYGMKEDLRLRSIVVGVNENNQDILSTENEEPVIVEDGQLCPPLCPPPGDSPLNP